MSVWIAVVRVQGDQNVTVHKILLY